MICISKESREFYKARETYINDKEELAEIKRKEKELEKKICESRDEYVTKGMIFFNEENRQNILKKAKSKGYSENGIKQISDLSDHWNLDYVDEDIINSMSNMQFFIENNKTRFEDSLLSKFGNFLDYLFSEGNDE